MGHQYAGANTFPVDFTIPDDGDPDAAVSFNVAYEALGDRTVYAKTHLDAIEFRLGGRVAWYINNQAWPAYYINPAVLATTTATFVQPASSANVTVTVASTAFLTVGKDVVVAHQSSVNNTVYGPGWYTVFSVTPPHTVVLTRKVDSVEITDAPTGTVVPIGYQIFLRYLDETSGYTNPSTLVDQVTETATRAGDIVVTDLVATMWLYSSGAATSAIETEFSLRDVQNGGTETFIPGAHIIWSTLVPVASNVYVIPITMKGIRRITSIGTYSVTLKAGVVSGDATTNLAINDMSVVTTIYSNL